jgi:hypothetical protein
MQRLRRRLLDVRRLLIEIPTDNEKACRTDLLGGLLVLGKILTHKAGKRRIWQVLGFMTATKKVL